MEQEMITRLCAQIVEAANRIPVCGEESAAQLLGLCRAARTIAAQVNKREEVDGDG